VQRRLSYFSQRDTCWQSKPHPVLPPGTRALDGGLGIRAGTQTELRWQFALSSVGRIGNALKWGLSAIYRIITRTRPSTSG
jgi:hypothetical protein